MTSKKRFIEETFPVKEVSIESAKEKNIRHGHISTLHIWWSRKPSASSRATNYATLIPASRNIDEWNKRRQFITELSKWKNTSNHIMINQAKKDVLSANEGKMPRVLDPFGGSGAIALEALRLGCETHTCDLNPISVLIQKCTVEYPQKYGKMKEVQEEVGLLSTNLLKNPLVEDVKKWGEWIYKEVSEEIGKFYPKEDDGSIPVAYYWMRTVPCQNPNCNTNIPLTTNLWLVNKSNKQVALYIYGDNKELKFRIVGTGYSAMPTGFDPDSGTISRAVAICPACGSVVDDKTTRRLFQEGKSGQKMMVTILYKPGTSGKRYRIATNNDMLVFREAEQYLNEKREKLMSEWGIDPVPDEPLKRVPLTFGVINVWVYGMNRWGDLFNCRQKLALITFSAKIRDSYHKMMSSGYEEEYAKAVTSYLAILLDKIASSSNTLVRWQSNGEKIADVFSRQAIPMIWDYPEVNMLTGTSRSFHELFKDIVAVIECASIIQDPAIVFQSSATSLPYSDNFFDAVFTDPPYYDNVPYSYLSDFFYVWLKRTIGDLYPELFSTPLTPKKDEIVAYSNGPGGYEDGKQFFERMLKKSFQEIYRVLKPDGIATIVYAHRSTSGWETLINSLLDSGLIMTGAWPLNTEMQARLRAQESATLASSIYIVARKMERHATGFYNDVKEELKQHLNKRLDQLWTEGISGADFLIAAIGSAIEVFGKYAKVMDYEGNIVRADRLLDDVREIATDYAVHQILHDGFAGEITDMTRFYVLWRWNYGAAKVPFDEARKLAQSCGIDLANEWNRQRFIKKEKEFIRVLAPQERQLDELRNSAEPIDVLHAVLLLWEKSNRSEMVKLLQKSGYGKGEVFYRVAQAISETLPIESKEKKLLDGFLSGRERLREEIRKEAEQRRLL